MQALTAQRAIAGRHEATEDNLNPDLLDLDPNRLDESKSYKIVEIFEVDTYRPTIA